MSPQKSPAFQFYPKDFMSGTATMSLQEVGAYMRLLCYQWDAGSVPTGADERARILGCAKSQEKELWKKVGKKFVLENDVYLNTRLEEERFKQNEFRRRQSDKGRASGAARQPKTNRGSTAVQPRFDSGSRPVEPRPVDSGLQPEGNSSICYLQSSSSKEPSKNDGSRAAGLILSPAQFQKLRESHAFVGSKLRVPNVLHSELLAKSGANGDAELRAWYERLNEELELSGKGTGDVFAWLRPRHQAFAIERGWVEAAPKPVPVAAAKPRGVAELLAEREAAKGRAS